MTDSTLSRLSATAEELPEGFTYIIGAAIFRLQQSDVPKSSAPKLLVVKRSATETTLPNKWEIPGGHIESRETVRDAIVRETFEETSLTAEKVVGEFEEMHYESRSGKKNVQMNFVVTVEQNEDVRLCADEHCEWKWIGEDEVKGLDCTSKMVDVLENAFAWSRKNRNAFEGACDD